MNCLVCTCRSGNNEERSLAAEPQSAVRPFAVPIGVVVVKFSNYACMCTFCACPSCEQMPEVIVHTVQLHYLVVPCLYPHQHLPCKVGYQALELIMMTSVLHCSGPQHMSSDISHCVCDHLRVLIVFMFLCGMPCLLFQPLPVPLCNAHCSTNILILIT